jgi:hypothetical protein
MIIRNSIIPRILSNKFLYIDIYAITLYPFVFVRDESDDITNNHESIHLAQQKELFVIPFYVLYVYEYFRNKLKGMDNDSAYRNISFEREAYNNQKNLTYLQTRDRMSWKKYRTQEVV